MAQRSQVIDITKSYLPGDPNAFVQNLVNTDREDGEEKTLPPLLFEGYNFLPTSYGYRSYFGVRPKLDIADLTSRVQYVLMYQEPDYSFKLIALAEDGIWLCDPGVAEATWTHAVTVTYDPDVLEEWTWCVIENVIYMYHQADTVVYYSHINTGNLEILNQTPTFLNMAGQMGIFKAGTRLGFWDSANSTAWSSNLNVLDFAPSIENFAGNQIFEAVVGRIVTVKGHGEGFIIYCTKSIVGATFDQAGVLLWDAKKIFDSIGVTHSRAVTCGQNDSEHIAYTTAGLYSIGKYNALSAKHDINPLAPEVYDFLRETRDPIWLDTINSRFVFFHILNPDYVYGQTAFSYMNVPPHVLSINGNPWDGDTLPAVNMDGNAAAEAIKQLVTFGFETIPLDAYALWTVIAEETQDGTIGPFSSTGSRAAEALGFTVADLNSTYLSGTSLPSELNPNPLGHTDMDTQYLGYIPYQTATVENAAGVSLIKMMQKQLNDWKMWNMHQIAAHVALEAASKIVNNQGTTVEYSTSAVTPPYAAPADVTTYSSWQDFETGYGNLEIQKDSQLKQIRLRKHKQQKMSVRRKKVVSYSWRQSGSDAGSGYTLPGNTVTFDRLGVDTLNPDSIDQTWPSLSTDSSAGWQTRLADSLAAQLQSTMPSSVIRVYDSMVFGLPSGGYGVGRGITGSGPYYVSTLYLTYSNAFSVSISYQPATLPFEVFYQASRYPWYLDSTETYTYEVTNTDEDLGHVDFIATMVAYGRTAIQVTSNPPKIVVESKVPIFPTGPGAVSFFPPAWNGTETLKIIAASAYSPWHYKEGTFGIELLGDPISSAGAAADAGGLTVYGSSSLSGAFDVTYTGNSYLMQQGAFSLLYPIFEGSLVYDLLLKKWGKQRNRFYSLIDMTPVNQTTPNMLIAKDMGMTAALKMADEDTIRIFDENPEDSVARYGKIGHYRLGMCNLLEVKALFRSPCTGILQLDASMDGRNIDPGLRYTWTYTNDGIVESLPDISARWFIVSLVGIYDLTGLETRDKVVSRR